MAGIIKQVTTTRLVLETLVARDDFMNLGQLATATGRERNQVSAALIHLHKSKAVDNVVVGEELWWCATPDTDQRVRALTEIKAVIKKPNRRPGRRISKGLPPESL